MFFIFLLTFLLIGIFFLKKFVLDSFFPVDRKLLSWTIFIIAIAMLSLGPLISHLRGIGFPLAFKYVQLFSYVLFSCFTMLFIFSFATRFLQLVVFVCRKPFRPGLVRPERFSLTLGLLVVISALVMSSIGIYQAYKLPAVKVTKIVFPHLHPDLAKVRFVQLSDLHLSLSTRSGFLEHIATEVKKQKPDAIFITGDLADAYPAQLSEDISILKSLAMGRKVFFVTGNHDYYTDLEGWLSVLRSINIEILENEHRVLNFGSARVVVAGVTDLNIARFNGDNPPDPWKATRGMPKHDLGVFLAHQPQLFSAADKFGFDIFLAGHTHGGQFVPFNLVARLIFPYVFGLHRYNNLWIYVTSGTGFWGPPLRLGVPGEIAVFELVSGEINDR